MNVRCSKLLMTGPLPQPNLVLVIPSPSRSSICLSLKSSTQRIGSFGTTSRTVHEEAGGWGRRRGQVGKMALGLVCHGTVARGDSLYSLYLSVFQCIRLSCLIGWRAFGPDAYIEIARSLLTGETCLRVLRQKDLHEVKHSLF